MEFLEIKRGGHMVIYKYFKLNFESTCKKVGTCWRCIKRTYMMHNYTQIKIIYNNILYNRNNICKSRAKVFPFDLTNINEVH